MNEKNYILNELSRLRISEPLGSDRYNELSKCMQWIRGINDKEEAKKKENDGGYAHTTIKWKDDEREEEAIIAVNCPYIEKYDEEILFYCDKDGFEKLKEYENGEDFVVVGAVLFTEDLY